MKSSLLSSPMFPLAIGLLLVVGIHKGLEATQNGLAAIPVLGMQSAPAMPESSALKALHPLVAESRKRNTVAAGDGDEISIDRAFIPREITPPAPAAPATPDYFRLLKDRGVITLVAITDHGAILNDRFHAFDSALDVYAYPASGVAPDQGAQKKLRTPILRRSTVNPRAEVLIEEGDRQKSPRRFTLAL